MIEKKRNVIIDTDPGIDDAIAIAIAAFSEKVDIKLVTTVAGNVSCDKVTLNAMKLLTFLKKEIPIAKGAQQPLLRDAVDASDVHGATGMEGFDFPKPNESLLIDKHAVNAIADVIRENNEKTTIVAIGPLTNIAMFIRMYPELLDKVEEIVMMGGALGRGNKGVLSEFNVAVDPEAARVVFTSGLPLALAPLDVAWKSMILPNESETIGNMNDIGQMMYQLFKKYRGGSFQTGLKMYDSFAIAYLLEPEMFTIEDVFVGIELQGSYTAGASVIDQKNYLNEKANCRVCTDVNPDMFKKWFMESIERCK
ncbi:MULTISPECIES: ribonucleoside hydrolase RihC [unclassified Breznakia]|uniref:ribonucleoside hydrolase RihC n=1 Tax=unclassified Breznakia TaxID=2623764 RepID=UPI0024755495|nr:MULTISPECIES: ribonucleoside hydrolase RihC [unclassified Breznakia]MDH6365936.1 non-specific riboncleoside hydrolase [Breznakia sp. PH1-1]MDH6403132.1 non-specific riboncleoside hydrolase [Breznakia sp. PF1-11]MDH6410841.1 non-specific riboncleoside hydrolase [Breznakia sp. PFB1-11]MDH6413102.1 non-specific riboncleoside hydrolase [Breznakia sp. PFB1-14]MDH6415470.1 non-specific riboncleoside hydrolase [Breznakia sp. PFB1-4]